MTRQMPRISLDTLQSQLTAEHFALVKGIVNSRTGELRASKPALPRKIQIVDSNSPYGYIYDYADEAGRNAGKTAYIWRMVAFFVSPVSQHQCMPCTADFDLPECNGMAQRRELAKQLDAIVDVVVNSIPKAQWKGVQRWAQVYGQYGTPQYNAEGAVVYR
jgi:hypothetical protein